MATLDYVDIPPAATRLRSASSSNGSNIKPAQRIRTTLPNPLPPASPPEPRRRSNSTTASGVLASQTMTLLPQLLMGPLPTVPVAGSAPSSPTNPRGKTTPDKVTLLSSRDPLSLAITTTNFKRFVAKVGPVFWFQDRVEEIVFWKRGGRRTTTWMAVYAFLCYFPRMILLIPHATLIAIILSSYPYSSDETQSSPPATPTQPVEGTAAWQANLQGIQNLMGFVSDMVTLAAPYTYHLCLSPAHLTQSTNNVSPYASPNTRSPYTPHILTLLVVTFFPLLFLVSLPSFPIREVALVIGLAPFIVTHPTIRALAPHISLYARKHLPILIKRYQGLLGRMKPSLVKFLDMPVPTVIERILDNDRLTDECLGAEMREVELFENQRYEGSTLVTESNGQGWSKQNLKLGERSAWTKGRDGWTGIGPEDEISSNLTFSLGPGWSFVETEDWRKDLKAEWADCGGSDDGWVYTNDAWLGPRPEPYTAGSGSVTRRRRWVRRVWYDPRRAVES